MVHIVFQHADVDALAASFALDENLRGDIFEIKDDYAVGPITGLYETGGREAREAWWEEVLSGGDYDGHVQTGEVNDESTVHEIRERLSAGTEENAWIWIAPNPHDVSGYYWLSNQLKEYAGQVSVMLLSNLPFINEKGQIFYPNNLFEIPPREFVKARKLARTLTAADFELDTDEWRKLAREEKQVRILEGSKKLLQYDADYFDKELLKQITPDWQKAAKVISHFLHKGKHTTGDAYLLWRLKKLVADQQVDAQGELKTMKDFEVKLPVGNKAISEGNKEDLTD